MPDWSVDTEYAISSQSGRHIAVAYSSGKGVTALPIDRKILIFKSSGAS